MEKQRSSRIRSRKREVEMRIPFETLVNLISQLPSKELAELQRRLDILLAKKISTSTGEEIAILEPEDVDLWEGELGQYILEEADDSVAIEEVRQALSAIRGSMAAEVSADRDEP